MVYGVLDARARTISFASAGHPLPLIINHETSYLELETGLPLGLGPSQYPERTISLSPGTHVLLYTDGITEAENGTDEEYGPERLVQHFLKPDACVDGLIDEVRSFGAASTRIDDATAVLLRSR
jgi:sigma-B regulation protein RsbU (phosphoserine phosphatase)